MMELSAKEMRDRTYAEKRAEEREQHERNERSYRAELQMSKVDEVYIATLLRKIATVAENWAVSSESLLAWQADILGDEGHVYPVGSDGDTSINLVDGTCIKDAHVRAYLPAGIVAQFWKFDAQGSGTESDRMFIPYIQIKSIVQRQ